MSFTSEIRSAFNNLVLELKLRLGVERIRMLDVPCGDMMWMPEFLKDREDVEYTGIDIVPELIERHRKDFADKPWTFYHQDIIKDGLKEKYHLINIRHMLQHLKTSDVLVFLAQISSSGGNFLFTSSFHVTSQNTDVGDELNRFRTLNLEAPPVALAAPLCYIRDGSPEDYKTHNTSMMMWKLPLRQVVGCNATRPMKVSADRCVGVDDYYSCGNWSV